MNDKYTHCPHCGKLVDKAYAIEFQGEFYCSGGVTITITHKTGRRIGNAQTGHITHVCLNGSWKALCGTEPGKRGDWSSYPKFYGSVEEGKKQAELVTCKKCQQKLKEL